MTHKTAVQGTALIPHSTRLWERYRSVVAEVQALASQVLGRELTKNQLRFVLSRLRDGAIDRLRRQGVDLVATNSRRLLDWSDPIGYRQPEDIRQAVLSAIAAELESYRLEEAVLEAAARIRR